MDAFVANRGQPNTVLWNDGSGNFTATALGVMNSYSRGVAFGDLDGSPDDEDGLIEINGFPIGQQDLMVGQLDASITINVQGAAGLLDAWIDFNGDGSWGGSGEQIADSVAVAIMGAEDFSYVLQHVPGAMAFLGVCPDDESPATAAPNHSNLMRVNEDAMKNGVALHAAMALVG